VARSARGTWIDSSTSSGNGDRERKAFTANSGMRYILSMMLLLTVGLARIRADDFYLWLFAYEASPRAVDSHTFATVARVSPTWIKYDTISWMPASLTVRIFANQEPGVNLTYSQTLALAASRGARITKYGPYRVTPVFYNAFMLRVSQLNSGIVMYKVNDRNTYPFATNCIHAVSGISGVRLHTGLSWGRSATEQVVRFFGL
jgi:hypothetical protein